MMSVLVVYQRLFPPPSCSSLVFFSLCRGVSSGVGPGSYDASLNAVPPSLASRVILPVPLIV